MDSTNSKKSAYWINLLEKLLKIDPELTFKPYELNMSYEYTTNVRILHVRTYPALPKDVFFTALKSKYFSAEFSTFLQIEIYCR